MSEFFVKFSSHSGNPRYYKRVPDKDKPVKISQKQYEHAISAHNNSNNKKHLPSQWVVGTEAKDGTVQYVKLHRGKNGKEMQLDDTNWRGDDHAALARMFEVVRAHGVPVDVHPASMLTSTAAVAAIPFATTALTLRPRGYTVHVIGRSPSTTVPVTMKKGEFERPKWTKAGFANILDKDKVWDKYADTFKACVNNTCDAALTVQDYDADKFNAREAIVGRMSSVMPALKDHWHDDELQYWLHTAKDTKQIDITNDLGNNEQKQEFVHQLDAMLRVAETNKVALVKDTTEIPLTNFLLRKDSGSSNKLGGTLLWWDMDKTLYYGDSSGAKAPVISLAPVSPPPDWTAVLSNMKTAFAATRIKALQ